MTCVCTPLLGKEVVGLTHGLFWDRSSIVIKDGGAAWSTSSTGPELVLQVQLVKWIGLPGVILATAFNPRGPCRIRSKC